MNKCKITIVLVFASLLQLTIAELYGQALLSYTLNLSKDLNVNTDKSEAILNEGDLQLKISVDINQYNGALLAGISHSSNDWGIDFFAGEADEMNLTFNKPVIIKSLGFRRSQELGGDDSLKFKVDGDVVLTLTGMTDSRPNDFIFNPEIALNANQKLVIISEYVTGETQDFAKELIVNKMQIEVVPELSSYAFFLGLPVFVVVFVLRFKRSQ